MLILSIDPGHKGGLALFEVSNKLTLLDTMDTPYDKIKGEYKYCDIFEYLIEINPDLVILENTLAIFSSGTTNAKEVGIGEGMWKCLFSLLHIEYEYLHPSVWTKQLGLKNDKKLTATANKKLHVELASELFPEFKSNFIGPRGGSKDGVADAVLIGRAWFDKKYKCESNATQN